MFSKQSINLLKNNWGERADTLNCFAEVKLIDPLSSWCCYIFAMDEAEENVQCLFFSMAMGAQIMPARVDLLMAMYNQEGDHPKIDREFRRTKVTELLRRLKRDSGGD